MTRKTDELIDGLSRDLLPLAPAPSGARFMVRWGLASAVLVTLSLLFQIRGDLGARVLELRFWAESAFWLLSAAVAAILVYRSAIPSRLKRGDQGWGILTLAGVAVLLAIRLFGAGQIGEGFWGEMDPHRGPCGPIILGMGLVAATGFFAWARRAAPTRQGLTGLWIAVSAGSLGAFAMQLVCAHDGALHVWIWHVTPVALLAAAGTLLGGRLLRWDGKTA